MIELNLLSLKIFWVFAIKPFNNNVRRWFYEKKSFKLKNQEDLTNMDKMTEALLDAVT